MQQQQEDERGGFSALPEDCISWILSFTSPRDACALSMVSSAFKSVADSDNVWENFLPPNYKDFVAWSSDDSLNACSSKKQLYIRLCLPVLLDGGTQSVNLEKNSGKVCFMLGSKKLAINWSDYLQWRGEHGQGICWGEIMDCWKWISLSHSRFAVGIELTRDQWLVISGKVKTRLLSPKTTYGAYLVFKLTGYAYGFGIEKGDEKNACSYGLADTSIKFVKGEGSASGTHTTLEYKRRRPVKYAPFNSAYQFPSEREGGWLELKLGKFYNNEDKDGEVEMVVKETDDDEIDEDDNRDWKINAWMGGLIVQGIELRPERDIALRSRPPKRTNNCFPRG